jgi:hypothetical protein
MISKIENKILFLEAVLKELERDFDKEESFDKHLLQAYAEEELIYNAQIKILKQILTEL